MTSDQDPRAIRLSLQPKQIDLGRLIEARGAHVATKLGFGGARGGAKSGAARRLMLARRLKHANTPGFIVRKNFPDIYENYIIKYAQEQPWLAALYNQQNKEYTLANGSRIAYKYADTMADVERISRGPEAVDIVIDQAEQFTEQELVMLMTPNRWPGSEPGFCKSWLFFNPGGPGTEFLRRVFHLKRFKDGENPDDYRFIQAYGWDNYEWFRGQVDIGPRDFYGLPDAERFEMFITRTDYGRKLNALPPALRVGELLGSFDSFSGQYFAGVWNEETCTITPDLAAKIIQPWWTRWMAQDWGFGDHAAHGWFASGKMSPSDYEKYLGGKTQWPMHVVICYREYIINARAEKDLALDIVERTPEAERKMISRFYLSVDAFGRKSKQVGANSVGLQFADVMRRHGLPSPEPADQRRVDGHRFLYNCLRQAQLRTSVITEEYARQGPALLISNECPNLIESFPLAIRDDDDREDVMRVDGALWEDCVDMARYGLLSHLAPKTKAPVDIRAKEVYNSIDSVDGDLDGSAMTARMMAMQKFELAETGTQRIGRPRWRP